MKRERAGTVLEIAALGPAIFAAAGPSFFTVREFAHKPESRRDIRFAEVFGTAFTLALGIGTSLSLEDHDVTPVLASVAVSAVMVGMYEYALRNPRSGSDMASGEPVGIMAV